MNQYAKIKENKVENIIVSMSHPEPSEEYVYIYENIKGIAIGDAYDPTVGFTPVKGDVITINDLKDIIDESEALKRKKEIARKTRNRILEETDWVITTTDHPQLEAYKTYRQKMRDWPSTENFPYNPPQL
jgi:hypothetical protein